MKNPDPTVLKTAMQRARDFYEHGLNGLNGFFIVLRFFKENHNNPFYFTKGVFYGFCLKIRAIRCRKRKEVFYGFC